MNRKFDCELLSRGLRFAQSVAQLTEFSLADCVLQPRVFRAKVKQRLRQLAKNQKLQLFAAVWNIGAVSFGKGSSDKLADSQALPGGVFFFEDPSFEDLMDDGCFDGALEIAKYPWQRHIAKIAMSNLQLEIVPSVPIPERTTEEETSPHRVLFLVTNSFPFTQSGYAVRTHSMLKALQNSGIHVEAMTRFGYPAIIGKPISQRSKVVDGITYHQMIDWRFPIRMSAVRRRAIAAVVEKARVMGATHIHTTTDFYNASVASAAAAQLGIPWIYEVRGEATETWVSGVDNPHDERRDQSLKANASRRLEVKAVEAAGSTVFLSAVSREHFRAQARTMPPSVIVPNSISEVDAHESRLMLERIASDAASAVETNSVREERKEAARRALGGFDDYKTWVGSVSALVDYEGFETLIESLLYLGDDVAVLLVGGGAAVERLEEFARSIGVAQRVRFAGVQPFSSINSWYDALDVFVVPRRDQDVCRRVTPIKAQKAMALGVPVVASDLPALREVTGGFATYFTPSNARELSAAIQNANCQDIAQSMAWIQEQVWDIIVQRLRDLY